METVMMIVVLGGIWILPSTLNLVLLIESAVKKPSILKGDLSQKGTYFLLWVFPVLSFFIFVYRVADAANFDEETMMSWTEIKGDKLLNHHIPALNCLEKRVFLLFKKKNK